MRKIFLIMVLTFLFKGTWAQRPIGEGTSSYTYYTTAKLHVTSHLGRYSAAVEKGDSTVFVYEYRAKDNPDIADDEYSEQIMFAIPAKANSFKYQAKDIMVIYLKGCFCVDGGYHRVLTGYVSGKKRCGKWRVKYQLEWKTMPDAERNTVHIIDASFKKGESPK